MVDNFPVFANAVAARFKALSADELFVVDTTDLWATYLAAFPAGTNPIYRTNTTHDCSCCRSFINRVGSVIGIKGTIRQTLWEHVDLPEPYATVSKRLRQITAQAPITSIFRTKERAFGAKETHKLVDTHVTIHNHFYCQVQRPHYSQTAAKDRGEAATTYAVQQRGLLEIKPEVVAKVIALAKARQLYRGLEFVSLLEKFLEFQAAWKSSSDPYLYLWANFRQMAPIRNMAIGTLLCALSNGENEQHALKAFETMMNPVTYRRASSAETTVTTRQVDTTLTTIEKLGLTSALDRRLACADDLSVNDVLWSNNSITTRLKDTSLRARLIVDRPAKPVFSQASTVDKDVFLSTILPQFSNLEMLVEPQHAPHFMTLTAPVDPAAGQLFAWQNNFAWSYGGDTTDAIVERVKAAGGATNVPLRVSLAWSNHDDLDLHCKGPVGHIYFTNKQDILDVDANGRQATTRKPVENMAFRTLTPGRYVFQVHNYARREARDQGFRVQVAYDNKTKTFAFPSNSQLGYFTVMTINIDVAGKITVAPEPTLTVMDTADNVNEKWGVPFGTFQPVNMLVASPNHWNGQAIGNLHYFFILPNAKVTTPQRGIYTEFLRPDLNAHRKVFELIGDRAKCDPTSDQLTGLGFSASRPVKITVRETATARPYSVAF